MTEKPEGLITKVLLPPGFLDPAKAREALRLVLEEHRWFRPTRYSTQWIKPTKLPKDGQLDFLVEKYEEGEWVQAMAPGDRHWLYLHPDRRGRRSHRGDVTLFAPVDAAHDEGFRAAHLSHVVQLMHVVDSPYAWSALDVDHDRKLKYWSDDGTLIMRLKNLDEGLLGLLWRNFLGPPLRKLFAARLASLPQDAVMEVDGILVVQPYALPDDALTPEGARREKELIAKLGPEYFYDHAREAPPSKGPELPPVDPPTVVT